MSNHKPPTSDVRPRTILRALALHVAGVLLGGALFLAAFPAGVLSSIGILFYRGLALVLVVAATHAVLLLVALRWLGRGRAVPAAGSYVVPLVTVAAALNLAFFVLVPVNLDRAISVFLLSWMDRQAAAVTQRELERAFQETYVTTYRAMDRRIAEQLASGNIELTPDGFRLTDRGHAFVAFARAVGGIFAVDPRFLYPPVGGAEQGGGGPAQPR